MVPRMNRLLPIVAGVLGLFPLQSAAQSGGMDMAVAQKWSAAKVVKYRVEGVLKGRESVVRNDRGARGDVVDRVTVEFSWDTKTRRIIEPVTVTDAKSEVGNLKSDGTNCGPPQLKGDYEHFQTVSHSLLSGDQVLIKGTRIYPAAKVSNYPASCSMRDVSGGKEEEILMVGGAGAEILGMPNVPGGPVTIAADRKSFSMKGTGNWVWTYTPTLVR
jgi:hypothetical protein